VRAYHKAEGAALVELSEVTRDAASFQLEVPEWMALAPLLLKGAAGAVLGRVDRAKTAELELPEGFKAAAVVRGAVLWDVATMVQRAGLEIPADALGRFPKPIPAVRGQAEGAERYFVVGLTPEELKAAQGLSAEERLATLLGKPHAERHVAVYAVRP